MAVTSAAAQAASATAPGSVAVAACWATSVARSCGGAARPGHLAWSVGGTHARPRAAIAAYRRLRPSTRLCGPVGPGDSAQRLDEGALRCDEHLGKPTQASLT